ncbi:hypothetical protein SEA_SLIMJIMMY_155 [Mycobacterium phage SlimJimmy]|nr:hypothetical protein SEA_SLIMJIMMY_155 [Mycobacterium phage SlimJimmy]
MLYRITHHKHLHGDEYAIDGRTVHENLSERAAIRQLQQIAISYTAGGWTTRIDGYVLTASIKGGAIKTLYRVYAQD